MMAAPRNSRMTELLNLHRHNSEFKSFSGQEIKDMRGNDSSIGPRLSLEIGDVILKSPSTPSLLQKMIRSRQKSMVRFLFSESEAHADHHSQWTHAAMYCDKGIAELTTPEGFQITPVDKFFEPSDRYMILRYTPLMLKDMAASDNEPTADELRWNISNALAGFEQSKAGYQTVEAFWAGVDAIVISILLALKESRLSARFSWLGKFAGALKDRYLPLRRRLFGASPQTLEAHGDALNFSQCANFVVFLVGLTVFPSRFREVSGKNILPCMISASDYFMPVASPIEIKRLESLSTPSG